jgi:hypothetical protein
MRLMRRLTASVVNGPPRSVANTKLESGNCRRSSRKARISSPRSGCTDGLPFLTRRTWRHAERPNSTCDHSKSQISEARRPWRKAMRIRVVSRWPYRPCFASLASFSTSAGVRYSRLRKSELAGRVGTDRKRCLALPDKASHSLAFSSISRTD